MVAHMWVCMFTKRQFQCIFHGMYDDQITKHQWDLYFPQLQNISGTKVVSLTN
jgi:hypothetical protein